MSTCGLAIAYDQRTLRVDDEVEEVEETKDRSFWVNKASETSVQLVEQCIEIINAFVKNPRRINYLKNYIGIHDGVRAGNFIYFKPRKSYVIVLGRVESKEGWVKRFEDIGLESAISWNGRTVSFNLRPADLQKNLEIVKEFVKQVVTDRDE